MTSKAAIEDASGIRLPVLADELLANARLMELPFDYHYDTWVLGQDSMRFLLALVRRIAPRKVIEYGSGVSTRALGLALGAGSVIRSFDHAAVFAERTRAAVAAAAGDVQVLHRAIGLRRFHGKVLPFYRVQSRDYDDVAPADLVVVDGPPGTWGREAALYSAFPMMRTGGYLLLDDAGRPGERDAVRAWQRHYGDAISVHLVPGLGNGMLVARKEHAGRDGNTFTLAERAGSIRQSLRALWRHRPRWLQRARGRGAS